MASLHVPGVETTDSSIIVIFCQSWIEFIIIYNLPKGFLQNFYIISDSEKLKDTFHTLTLVTTFDFFTLFLSLHMHICVHTHAYKCTYLHINLSESFKSRLQPDALFTSKFFSVYFLKTRNKNFEKIRCKSHNSIDGVLCHMYITKTWFRKQWYSST